MLKYLTACVLAAGLLAVSVQGAAAWTSSGGVTGSNGKTATHSGSGSCSNGTCSSTHSATGPNGQTVSSQGSTSCSNGTCSSTHTGTGANGGTATRSGTVTK